MLRNAKRGVLVVFEGCDGSGKSTQCKKLVEALQLKQIQVEKWRFPERETNIGQMIDRYLKQESNVEDHAIHLLFAANRWELVPKMIEKLQNGITLIIDRYAFSGVAYSGAKPSLSLEWCKAAEKGLPKPDLVYYLDIPVSQIAKRSTFGDERYETTSFQERVAANYSTMFDDSWKIIDANRDEEIIHQEILESFTNCSSNVKDNVDVLWHSN